MSIERMHILVAIVLFMMTQFSHEEAFYDPSYLSFGCVNFRNANGKTELQDDFSHKSLHWRCPVVHSVVVEGEISPYENLVISLPNYSSSCSYFLDQFSGKGVTSLSEAAATPCGWSLACVAMAPRGWSYLGQSCHLLC